MSIQITNLKVEQLPRTNKGTTDATLRLSYDISYTDGSMIEFPCVEAKHERSERWTTLNNPAGPVADLILGRTICPTSGTVTVRETGLYLFRVTVGGIEAKKAYPYTNPLDELDLLRAKAGAANG